MLKLYRQFVDEIKMIGWRSNVGLGFLLIVTISLSISVISELSKVIPIEIATRVNIIILLVILSLVVWLISGKKWLIKGGKKKIVIAISIRGDENSQKHLKAVQEELVKRINDAGICNLVGVVDLSFRYHFQSNEEAEKYAEKNNYHLLLWGRIKQGTSSNVHGSVFDVKVTYLYNSRGKKEFAQAVQGTIQEGVIRPKWTIWEPDTLQGVTTVSDNIIEIALYTLGVCLASIPAVQALINAEKMFAEFYLMCRRRESDRFPGQRKLEKSALKFSVGLSVNLCALFSRHNQEKETIYYGEKVLEHDRNVSSVYQNLARAYYLEKGDLELAKKCTDTARRLNPRSDLPDINKAFFATIEERWGLVIWVLETKIRDISDTSVEGIVNFLDKEFNKSGSNLGILFLAGWFQFKFGDCPDGTSRLRSFIEVARGVSEYGDLVEKAKELVGEADQGSVSV